MKEKVKQISIYLSIVILIIIDQVIKFIIENNKQVLPVNVIQNFLNLSYCQNTGIAFGLGSGNVLVFIICNIVVLGVILKFIISGKQTLEGRNKFILGLVLAGGTSNLIDRITRGYVVDYIDINNLISFPIFNLADILVCIGVIGIGIASLKYIKLKDKQEIEDK